MRMTMGKATAMLTIMATRMCHPGTRTPTQPARPGGAAA
jgi:hypothetical protein